MSKVSGQVLCGINNIYTVAVADRKLQCRIKGKVLKTDKRQYNPIAVGDLVEVLPDAFSQGEGWIISRKERSSSLERWNKKRRASQVLAANAELLMCVASIKNPPFRPRFIDRVIISTELGGLIPVVLLNKCDLGVEAAVRERVEVWEKNGYRVIRCSALTGEGISDLGEVIKGNTVAFVGQSGVGKSSILNCLEPRLKLKVGEISSKYDRGVHTTNFAVMIALNKNTYIIDTPGIREFEVSGITQRDLHGFFPEFSPWSEGCAYSSCLHIDEPGCAVKEALERGDIHADRYSSYVRLFNDLSNFQKGFYGSAHN
ncbi:MAG: ribosome small subunit-dependent GTPase A [Spirochaeta sp.]|nr:ribosome small subunit-dependent GTPase A [Spirochaeta sp.]